MPSDRKCETCALWQLTNEKGSEKTGDCRLHPPVLNVDSQMWEFPQTRSYLWCGDWCKGEV